MTADRLLFLALKVTNRNIRKRCDIYLKLTIKTLERRHDIVVFY